MDVILHIGAHRTASTFLQTHMATHRNVLADAGVVYWGPKITRGGLFRGAIGGVEPAMTWQQRRFNGRCAMRAAALRQSGAAKLIISDENMLGSLRATLEDTKLYPDAGRRISAHAGGFADHRLTIGLCIRSYAEWWTSSLAFRLPRGGAFPHTHLREHLVTQPRRWRRIVEELARVLPDATLMVWTYEALGDKPHLVVQDLCGVSTPPAIGDRRSVGRGPETLRAALADHGLSPSDIHWPDDQRLPFAPHEAEALDAQYAEDLAWLAAGAGGLADFIDAPAAPDMDKTAEQTVDGKGTPDDGHHRYLA